MWRWTSWSDRPAEPPTELPRWTAAKLRVPPVAMSAYYLKSVVPQWSIGTIYKGMGEFMVIQVICLIACYLWPEIAMWLVNFAR